VVRKIVEEKNLLEINLLNALEMYQPITAKELVKILNSEFNMKADRSTVNSKLYSMLSENRVTRDDRLCWELAQ